MASEEVFVFHRLADGKEVPTHVCDCGNCRNEFYVPAISDEWMPNMCPFCGTRFIRREFDGEAADYQPAADGSALDVIKERDELEEQIEKIYKALGGTGEWCARVPPEDPPNSGDLGADALALASRLREENEGLKQRIYNLQCDLVLCEQHDAGEVAKLRSDNQQLRSKLDAAEKRVRELETLHTLADWCEEDGNVLWWRVPIEEPPYSGHPHDSDWAENEYDDYYTHWSRLPNANEAALTQGASK